MLDNYVIIPSIHSIEEKSKNELTGFLFFGRYVTYLPVDGGAASTTLEIGSQAQQQPPQAVQHKGAAAKANNGGAVFDNVSESGSDDVSSERSWVLRAEQDNLGRNIVYMKKMLHPKLQAIFDKPIKPDYSSQTLPNRGHKEERSISQSLALINHSLGEVNAAGGAASGGGGAEGGVLAPPPGFSDSETFSDTDSFSSNGSQAFRGKTVDSIQALSHQLHQKADLMTRSLGPVDQGAVAAASATSSAPKKNRVTFAKNIMTSSDYECKASSKKEFRNKPLIGWSTNDVCDWLDSLFMPEYKPAFVQNEVDGFKLASITKGELESMGVIRVGHMMNIEKSLKRYLTA